jgi:Uma2 family endonuclease
MGTVTQSKPPLSIAEWNLADLAARWGSMPIDRIRMPPRPGSATEADAIDLNEHNIALCELLDGILLEKTVGFRESLLTAWLIQLLGDFLTRNNLGVVLPPDTMMRLWPGRIRLPDVSFISWGRFANGQPPSTAMFDAGPDLAVEIISPSNTRQEMQEKLEDYFTSGVLLVWYVYPARREVHVFTGVDKVIVLNIGDKLSGGEVLPGFELDLAKLFTPPAKPQG